jgi:hypothetical protein
MGLVAAAVASMAWARSSALVSAGPRGRCFIIGNPPSEIVAREEIGRDARSDAECALISLLRREHGPDHWTIVKRIAALRMSPCVWR